MLCTWMAVVMEDLMRGWVEEPAVPKPSNGIVEDPLLSS